MAINIFSLAKLKAVNSLLDKVALFLKQKYHMIPISTVISMAGGRVKGLGLEFRIQGPLSREDIRKTLILAAQDFLTLVNSDEAIRPYLKNYPFTIRNIEIILFLIDSKGVRVDDPYIGIAGILEGRLIYKNLITTDIPIFKSRFEESYEEALEILRNQTQLK